MTDARHEPGWGEISLLFSDVQVEAAASVPIELAGGPIGTLDVYAGEPRDWDQSEISALQANAGVVASLLAAAAQAQVKGRLARARQAEQRAHQRAIALHEQAASQHDRLGKDEVAQAERDRADHTRKRLDQALAEDEEVG